MADENKLMGNEKELENLIELSNDYSNALRKLLIAKPTEMRAAFFDVSSAQSKLQSKQHDLDVFFKYNIIAHKKDMINEQELKEKANKDNDDRQIG